jgi:hypothetical protein
VGSDRHKSIFSGYSPQNIKELTRKILKHDIRHAVKTEALQENYGNLFGVHSLYDLKHKILKIML